MDLITNEAKGSALLATRKGARRRKLITERLRKIAKASDRNDWFNLIALMILLGIVIACVVFYFSY